MQFIDCHNHSLPFIDDGAKDIEMALAMLKVAQSNNISDIVLTPHHLNGAFNNNSEKVKSNFTLLKEKAFQENIDINLHLGSEVHLTHETAKELISHTALTYCDLGKAALIELPKHSIPVGTADCFKELIANGITPIIAHPERNSSIRKDISVLGNFISLGCKSQLTAMSLTGEFGPDIQSASNKIIKLGYAHLVASDAHRPSGRLPSLLPAYQYIKDNFGNITANSLFHENPQKLMQGKKLINLKPLNIETSLLQSLLNFLKI